MLNFDEVENFCLLSSIVLNLYWAGKGISSVLGGFNFGRVYFISMRVLTLCKVPATNLSYRFISAIDSTSILFDLMCWPLSL
jgi:hypothetical protein